MNTSSKYAGSYLIVPNTFNKKIISFVTYDSTNIYIEKSGIVKYKYSVRDSNYIEGVYYDRITGLISFNICTPTRKDERGWIIAWNYKLIVWDYHTNKSWNIKNGKSEDGERYHQERICNFSPETNYYIKLIEGSESTAFTEYNNGLETSSKSLGTDYIRLLAIFNRDSILVSESMEDTCYFYIYNIRTDQKKLIGYNQVLSYDDLILKQFGKNIHYLFNRDKRIKFYKTDWNPQGNTCIYKKFNHSEKKQDYFLYDKPTDKSELIKTDKIGIIPIWR